MEPADELIAGLEERLRRYRADRYPIQHAIAQFELGATLTGGGQTARAVSALNTAARLFAGRLPAEEARALNALGAALRLSGQLDDAVLAFRRAAEGFQAGELPAEHGAALFNLGLAQRERGVGGSLEETIECFTRAEELLRMAGKPRHAGAAAREGGAALLMAGRLDEAAAALAAALAIAEETADHESRGATLNLLGLMELAAGRPDDAILNFRGAAASHPRSVRPDGYAMARANLALAYEQAGAHARARLAARQALGARCFSPAITEQAAGVLERLGDPAGDLPLVLGEEPAEDRAGIIREEVVRWADADAAERRREAAAWLAAQICDEHDGTAMCEAWLGALLELPPGEMESLIRAMLEAVGKLDRPSRERFRRQASSAMARFHVPQWLRLKDTFNGIAAELPVEGQFG